MKNRLLILLFTLSCAHAQTIAVPADVALDKANSDFIVVKSHYKPLLLHTSDPNYEQNRGKYFTELADILFPLTNDIRGGTPGRATFVQSLAKEILSYSPQRKPEDQDLVGSWATPRHNYSYNLDHTWNFIPNEVPAAGGTWRIDGFNITTNRTVMIWSITPDTLIEKDNGNLYFASRITPINPSFRWGYRR